MNDGFFDILPDTTPKRKAKPPDTRPLERDVQKHIIAALRKRGLFVARVNAGSFTHEGRHIAGAEAGHSDLCGCVPPTGQAFYIEVKRRGETPTPKQRAFLAARAADGALACWADSVPMALKLFGFEPTPWETEL